MYPQNASWSILTQPCSPKIQGSSSTEGCNRYFWGRCVGDMEAQRFPQREQLVFSLNATLRRSGKNWPQAG